MDDNLSIKSSDSVTISGEYEIVNEDIEPHTATLDAVSPALKIANNGDHRDLEKNLTEMIYETEQNPIHHNVTTESAATSKNQNNENRKSTLPLETLQTQNEITDLSLKRQSKLVDINNKIGQSTFYDCLEYSPTEKHDAMKPDSDTEEDVSDIGQHGSITFDGITSLGTSAIDAPKSEIEIQRKMSELNASHKDDQVGMKVSVSIPSCHEGYVALQDESKTSVIKRYEINRILFYAHGVEGTPDEACFAFTFQATNAPDTFQCHIFRCNLPEAVKQVSAYFAKAFQLATPSLMTSITLSGNESNAMNASMSSSIGTSNGYEFTVSLQIREKMNKSTYSVPRDRTGFRLRCNTEKEIIITVTQAPVDSSQILHIDRCFGILMSSGKLQRQSDMHLLDLISVGYAKTEQTGSGQGTTMLSSYIVQAEWKADDKNFELLNQEFTKTHISFAIDVVIRAIVEPVRFVIETPVAIQPQHEMRLMDHFNFSGNKKPLTQRFYLQLKDNNEGGWQVSSIDPLPENVEQSSMPYNSSSIFKNIGINSWAKMTRSTSNISIGEEDISADYSSDGDEPLVSGTGEVPEDCPQIELDVWLPVIYDEKGLKAHSQLVRNGIPEKLRGIVWKLLTNVDNSSELIDKYRVLLTQETKCETTIQRDIHRTFPTHKKFSEYGGSGQDVLFKVSKAYAVYDTEVGYCQGLSFIAASLLIHMPEEDAFCVLVALMYNYGLRNLYKDGFDILYLHLYQLNRLIKDQLPKLYDHFEQNGVETHMFASQWFLTLFTARFPLYFVFHILDVFLLDGMQIIFQVAITLLTEVECELRMLDFEGMLKYFRVVLPKRCRKLSVARKLMKKACDRKVKKLKQYKEEFMEQKLLEEKKTAAEKQYEIRFDEERKQLRADIQALRIQLEQTLEKSKQDKEKKTNIIDEYKQVIQRNEQEISKLKADLNCIHETVLKCPNCVTIIKEVESNNTKNDSKSLNAVQLTSLGPLDPLECMEKRVNELEQILAQTKLELVESKCRNQDLTHQLNTLITEIESNKNSWQPWLSKTINSIQEKVVSTRRDLPSFQSYTSNSPTSSYNSLERNLDLSNTCSNSSGRTNHAAIKTDDANSQRQ